MLLMCCSEKWYSRRGVHVCLLLRLVLLGWLVHLLCQLGNVVLQVIDTLAHFIQYTKQLRHNKTTNETSNN